VPAPRFKPCQCAIAARSTLTPASELMPDRCTPEYERTLAKMGAWLPYRRARRFLSELFPLGADLHGTRRSAAGPCVLGWVSNRRPCRGRNCDGRRHRRKRLWCRSTPDMSGRRGATRAGPSR
jgi:hypothetical protein